MCNQLGQPAHQLRLHRTLVNNVWIYRLPLKTKEQLECCDYCGSDRDSSYFLRGYLSDFPNRVHSQADQGLEASDGSGTSETAGAAATRDEGTGARHAAGAAEGSSAGDQGTTIGAYASSTGGGPTCLAALTRGSIGTAS